MSNRTRNVTITLRTRLQVGKNGASRIKRELAESGKVVIDEIAGDLLTVKVGKAIEECKTCGHLNPGHELWCSESWDF